MKAEDLFEALGAIDVSRLEKCEKEGTAPMKKTKKITRRLLLAAAIATALAGTAYAAVNLLLYETPAQMIQGLYGSDEAKAPTQVTDPWKADTTHIQPGYEKQPVEATVAQALEQMVFPVGQSATLGGNTLTVDACVYDSETQSGFVTLVLEHEKPLDETWLQPQYDGQITPYLLDINQYGYAYRISEKTTENVLAMTFYFHKDIRSGKDLTITLVDDQAQKAEREASMRQEQERTDYIASRKTELAAQMTREEADEKCRELYGFVGEGEYDSFYFIAAYEFDAALEYQPSELDKVIARLKQELTPEQAVREVRSLWGDTLVEQTFAGRMEELEIIAYSILGEYELDAQPAPGKLVIALEDTALPSRSFGGGDVIVNALNVRVNTEKYTPGSTPQIELNMADGSVFTVCNEETENTVFKLVLPDGATLCMLNSAIDPLQIQSVTLTTGTDSFTIFPD